MIFPVYPDRRGLLLPIEHTAGKLPFIPRRSFVIWNVPRGRSRAAHALTCHQIIVLVSGSMSIGVRWRGVERRYRLERSGEALLVPKHRRLLLHGFSRSTVVLVLASAPYQNRSIET
jgi:UDP-2-acetamido-3-amino-2,3-dideoxy-glucuronate N-acetyltransferase